MLDFKLLMRGSCATACLSLAAGAAGQASPAPPLDRAAILVAARELMVKARYCGLVTLGPGGQPQARLVDPFVPEEDFSVWIATNPVTRKVKEIRDDGRVTLFYVDPGAAGLRDGDRQGHAGQRPGGEGPALEGRLASLLQGQEPRRRLPADPCRPQPPRGRELPPRRPERPADLAAHGRRPALVPRARIGARGALATGRYLPWYLKETFTFAL